jgi:hypothetical protein
LRTGAQCAAAAAILTPDGARLLASTPEEAKAFAAKERGMWQEVVKISGLKPQ